MSSNEVWNIRIGIEMHAQILSSKKILSFADNKNDKPNMQVDILDIGMPGALPIPNPECINLGLKTALALNCDINNTIGFDRKHYKYPDLPSGYQITQNFFPIGYGGHVMLTSGKRVGLYRLHLEQDAAKLVYTDEDIGIDFNRSGVGLMEIVSKPDIESAEQAVEYVRFMRAMLIALGTCDGSMENGSIRCDVNLSVFRDERDPQVPVEIKNINSPRFIKNAINYEANRQIQEIQSGRPIVKQTRLFDAKTKTTHFMRNKETAIDYCYFPDMDLCRITIPQTHVDKVKAELPLLPDQKMAQYASKGISKETAFKLAFDPDLGNLFDDKEYQFSDKKQWANFVVNLGCDVSCIDNEAISQIAQALINNTITKAVARDIIINMPAKDQRSYTDNALEDNAIDKNTEALKQALIEICNCNPKELEKLRGGDKKIVGWFIGQALKRVQADPRLIPGILKEIIGG